MLIGSIISGFAKGSYRSLFFLAGLMSGVVPAARLMIKELVF